MSSQERFLIEEVEKILGVKRATLYGWERTGKVPKAERDPMSNYRYWTKADLKKLKRLTGRE